MNSIRILAAVLLAGCAATPPSPTTIQSDQVRDAWSSAMPGLQTCYRDYLATFGGRFEDGELQPSERGPTINDRSPFSGDVAFVVQLTGSEATATSQPEVDPELDACWHQELAANAWPTGRAQVMRVVTFETN